MSNQKKPLPKGGKRKPTPGFLPGQRHQQLAYHVPDQAIAIRRSRYILDRLRQDTAGLNTNDRRVLVLRTLRQVNPFVFEEVMLSAAEEHGWLVQRPDYVLDGGIDGSFTIGNELWLHQAKRYSGPIIPEHVAAFVEVVRKHPEAIGGLFSTTGKTCLKSRYYEQKTGRVLILSGDSLVDFLLYPFNG